MKLTYEAHEGGRSFADILHETEQAIMQQVDRMPQFDLGVMSDYREMKPKLMTELIPQKGNDARLVDVPHEKIEDLALMLIASIPFYRNLAEYCGNEDDYLKLTCFLHYKTTPIDTQNATLTDLWSIISGYVTGSTATFGTEKFYDTVQFLATDIAMEDDDISLENKLIVSIASRLRAEMYLKTVITAQEGNCPDSDSNQMRDWYEKARPYLTADEVTVMDEINLITPEAIHLNAFMYEPLIDVSIWSLNDIFGRTVLLGETT